MTKNRVSAIIMKVLNHPPHAVDKLAQTGLNGLLLALMKNEFRNKNLRQLLLRDKNPMVVIHPSLRFTRRSRKLGWRGSLPPGA